MPVTSPGTYHVLVSCGEQAEISEAIKISTFSSPSIKEGMASKLSSATNATNKPAPAISVSNASKYAAEMQLDKNIQAVKNVILFIGRKKITFSSADEIERGNFGTVYRAKWAGTDVAVKCMKVRNLKAIQSVIETEAWLYKARHVTLM